MPQWFLCPPSSTIAFFGSVQGKNIRVGLNWFPPRDPQGVSAVSV